MRAAIFTGPEQPLSVEEVTPQPPGPEDVVVRVGASGVCHSDLSIIHGYLPMPPPCILGHEGAGTVLEVGSAVSRVKPGDKIISSFTPACGNCWYCLHDKSNLCQSTESMMAPRTLWRSSAPVPPGSSDAGDRRRNRLRPRRDE